MEDAIEERVWAFNIVRDIPYYIGVSGEQDYSCATKPYILEKLLREQGLKVRHILCEFRWSAMELPERVSSIPHEDVETHQYLEVKIPNEGRWVVVDPTWDSRLQHPTFHINEWDGMSDTQVAVPAHKTWSAEQSKKRIAELDNMSEEEFEAILKKNGDFYRAFNKWIQELRMRS